jgi:hypothetical protein
MKAIKTYAVDLEFKTREQSSSQFGIDARKS